MSEYQALMPISVIIPVRVKVWLTWSIKLAKIQMRSAMPRLPSSSSLEPSNALAPPARKMYVGHRLLGADGFVV